MNKIAGRTSRIRRGDLVALTPIAFRMRSLLKMSPRVLCQRGRPNSFKVTAIYESKDDGICISLDGCCLRLKGPGGRFKCKAHPIEWLKWCKTEKRWKPMRLFHAVVRKVAK